LADLLVIGDQYAIGNQSGRGDDPVDGVAMKGSGKFSSTLRYRIGNWIYLEAAPDAIEEK
jgi:hypothetical protein